MWKFTLFLPFFVLRADATAASAESAVPLLMLRPLTIKFNRRICSYDECANKGSSHKTYPSNWMEIANSPIIHLAKIKDSSSAVLKFTWKNASENGYWDHGDNNHLLRVRLLSPCPWYKICWKKRDGIFYEEVASSRLYSIAPNEEFFTVYERFDVDHHLVSYGFEGSMYVVEALVGYAKYFYLEVKDFEFSADSSFVRVSNEIGLSL